MPNPNQIKANEIEATSYYVRNRHAMAVFADFGGVYEDYYLHLMQVGMRPSSENDEMLKEGLAALTLHLMARPRDEVTAWTFNFREPPLNLFVTGDTGRGNVVGRIFTEDVKVSATHLMYAQVTRPRYPSRQSTVEVHGRDLLRCVEDYYGQSEQLPARLFRMGGDAYAMLVAQPDIDLKWFQAMDVAAMGRLADEEELGLLERRQYHFECGCDLETVLSVVVRAFAGDLEAIFQGEPELTIQCPRCAGGFKITPAQVEAFNAEQDPGPT